MIVVPEDPSFLLITQPDHAHLAGEILSLWRADGLPDNPRRDDLLFAAREHDNGWREADAAPRWDAGRGRPHDFLTLPARERIAVWERGVCRFAAGRPYPSLLIARHALNLFGGRRGEQEWDRLLDFLEDFERNLLEETGVEPETLEEDYRWLDLADQISLAACARWRQPAGRYGMRIVPAPVGEANGAVGLDPFPLAGATTFRIASRRIPARAYRGDADLGGELAAARWEERTVRIMEVSPAP
jgi:Protein of unknown function (DUF3891)